MRHVDEGVLHAWLDGALEDVAAAGGLPAGETVATVEAHLRTCSHCQALIERERAVRGEAGLILQDTAAGPVDVPPFELVAAGRAAPAGDVMDAGARPARTTYRMMPMAWAATVLLALGAGWWGSVMWQDGADGTDAAVARDVVAEEAGPDPAAASPLASGEAAAEARVSEGPTSSASAAEPSAPGSREPVGGAASPAVAAAPAPARPVGEPTGQAQADATVAAAIMPAPVPPIPPLGDAVAASRDVIVVREEPAVVAEATVSGVTTLAPLTTLSASAGGAVPRGARPATLQMLPTGGRLAGRTAVAASTEGVAIERTPLPMFTFRDAVAAARDGSLYWRPAPGFGSDVLVIQGASVVGVDVATLYDGSVMSRVRHRLADGATVELLQWQDPDEPPARAAPVAGTASALFLNTGRTADGRNEVMMRVPALGAFVMVTADMEAELLLRLADALVVRPR